MVRRHPLVGLLVLRSSSASAICKLNNTIRLLGWIGWIVIPIKQHYQILTPSQIANNKARVQFTYQTSVLKHWDIVGLPLGLWLFGWPTLCGVDEGGDI